VVFLALVQVQGEDLRTRLASSLGSVLEMAFCLDLEIRDQETDFPSGAEVKLVVESYEGGTELVRGHPTVLLAAAVVASVPCSAG